MIIFRADGNSSIGSGHIMRCLSIADAADRAGYPCIFISADHKFEKIISDRGYRNVVMNTNYENMDEETDMLLRQISKYTPSVLVVDSYYVTEHYLSALWRWCKVHSCKLVYMDDVLSFAYPCDVLINYNIYGLDKQEEYKNMYESANIKLPQFLLGPNYAPLRREFQSFGEAEARKEANSILISTGGADPEHMAVSFVKCIVDGLYNDYKFHLIIGMMNTDMAKIRQMAAECDNIILHQNISNMSELMRSCDVAVSAAGSTLYELCAMQIPTITYILADNQVLGAKEFENHGILQCAGDVRVMGTEALTLKLLDQAVALADDFEKRVKLAKIQKSMLDGKGASRIVMEVL